MITTKLKGNGFAVHFAAPPEPGLRSFSVFARNLSELHTTLDHWWNVAHQSDQCPLCRFVKAREKARKP